MIVKQKPLRDPAYLKAIRDMRCIITGQLANENESVVAAHIGTRGKGYKNADDEVLPVLATIHAHEMHAHGEITTLRQNLPDDVLRAALRAYARELYREWKAQ